MRSLLLHEAMPTHPPAVIELARRICRPSKHDTRSPVIVGQFGVYWTGGIDSAMHALAWCRREAEDRPSTISPYMLAACVDASLRCRISVGSRAWYEIIGSAIEKEIELLVLENDVNSTECDHG